MQQQTTFRLLAVAAITVSLGMNALPLVHAKPAMPKPAVASNGEPVKPMAQPDEDMKRVLDSFKSLHPKPIEKLTPAEARKQPTIADAVKKILKAEGKSTAPLPGVTATNTTYPGPGGMLPARIYTPERGDGLYPVIVYYHGGGWVIANLDTYDSSARALALGAKAIVVSVEYRHAPEHKFPAAHEDAFAAYEWVLQNAPSFNGNPKIVAVAGESAGGNLAANVAIHARDKGIQAPVHQLLVYPVAGVDTNTESYLENANAKPLNKPMMLWFFKHVLKGPEDKKSPMLDLVHANLKGLPPATVITAQIDPLRSEGQMLAQKLKEAGNWVDAQTYTGVTHEFFGTALVVDKAKAANKQALGNLKDAFKAEKKELKEQK